MVIAVLAKNALFNYTVSYPLFYWVLYVVLGDNS